MSVAPSLRIRIPLSLGLLGQGCTFGALLVPIAFRMHAAISASVLVSAVATILVLPGLISAHSVLPVQPTLRAVKVALLSSCSSLLIVVLAVSALGEPLAVLLDAPQTLFLLAGGQLLLQGLQTLGLAVLIRFGNVAAVGRARLVYGISILAATIGASIWFRHVDTALIVATMAAFAIVGAYTLLQERDDLSAVLRSGSVRVDEVLTYWWRHAPLTSSALFEGVSSQALGLVVGRLGPLSASWAIVTRVGGGFSTVTQQLVAPTWDIRFAAAIRDGHRVAAWSIARRALGRGGALAAVTVVVSLVLAWASRSMTGLGAASVLLVVGSAIGFWGATICASTVFKHLAMGGAGWTQFCWSAVRALGLGSVVVLLPGPLALGTAAACTAAFMIVYVLLLRRSLTAGEVDEAGGAARGHQVDGTRRGPATPG